MEQIYEQHLWGGKTFDFYSGEGSHNTQIIQPYLNVVTGFLISQDEPLTVCDLGCGDFNVGEHLVPHSSNYIAIDIVESLIDRNKKLYKADNLEFRCLDIAKDELPKTDCVILRQVLQHLSNQEIQSIVKKLSHYKYIILTEHLPRGTFVPNIDMISSQGNRLKLNSGVDLLAEPFNLKIKEQKLLVETIVDHGRITTTLFTRF
ncbi:class I SAM-dependent methyltransferase [Winogradskyella sp. A3E31]|uniref:class I SAM-dependent methyltransferase n=1 Tax=Winogradskyella sp. A3E31 TaxID=3349637 RepID=UPI00398B98FD